MKGERFHHFHIDPAAFSDCIRLLSPRSYRATQIKTYSWDNAQVILVGNKCELEDDRLVPTEDSQRLAKDLGEYHPQQHAVFAKAIQQEVTLPQHTDLMRTHRYSRGHRTLKPKYLICFS